MLEFISGNETEVMSDPVNTPKAAFVIVESPKGYMLLYNTYRHLWELAGGFIDQGELPQECAIRECKEESNQNISNLKFVGLAKYTDMNASIYYAFLHDEEPFTKNDEISELRWWKPNEDIDKLDSLSIELIKLHNPILKEEENATRCN